MSINSWDTALFLLKHERYKAALAVLENSGCNDAFTKWKIGCALTGMSRYKEAATWLEKSYLGLDEINQARCNMDFAILHNRSSNPDVAIEFSVKSKIVFQKLGCMDDLLKLEVVHLISLQKKGEHSLFLNEAARLNPRLKEKGLNEWYVILELAVCSCQIQVGNIKNAEITINTYLPTAKKLNLCYRICGFYIAKSEILYQQGNLDIALLCAQKAEKYAIMTGSDMGVVQYFAD